MIVYPIAKINLGLNVVEKRSDGYHNLQTVFYPVPIKDALEVHIMDDGYPTLTDCDLKVDNIHIEGNEQNNLVVRAYHMVKEDFPDLPRIHIHLWKSIPLQAGMGGGSSDGAYMLLLLNRLFNLELTEEQMLRYAARLGADCPFFIKSVPCNAEGIGEVLQENLLDLSGWYLAIVKPNIPVSTKEAFSMIHPHWPENNCFEVVKQPAYSWKDSLVNDFEESVFSLHPEIGSIKEQLYNIGATYASMTGSGSALYGLFRESPAFLQKEFPGMFTFNCML